MCIYDMGVCAQSIYVCACEVQNLTFGDFFIMSHLTFLRQCLADPEA